MLTQLHAVLPAADLGRAREFYHDKLGLDPDETHEGLLVYHLDGGTSFQLYESTGAGLGSTTQMGWHTDDLEAEMTRLRDRGVVFEEYDVPGLRTVDGIATSSDMRSAWFRDSEGNFLCLSQML